MGLLSDSNGEKPAYEVEWFLHHQEKAKEQSQRIPMQSATALKVQNGSRGEKIIKVFTERFSI